MNKRGEQNLGTASLAAEIQSQARGSMMSALAMHDAATVLQLAAEFEKYCTVKQRVSLHPHEVVGFILSYGKALVGSEAEHFVEQLRLPEDGGQSP